MVRGVDLEHLPEVINGLADPGESDGLEVAELRVGDFSTLQHIHHHIVVELAHEEHNVTVNQIQSIGGGISSVSLDRGRLGHQQNFYSSSGRIFVLTQH